MSVDFFLEGGGVICSVGWFSREILVSEMLDPWGCFLCVCVCVCLCEWGGGIGFSGAQFAGRGIGGGERERWKGDFYSLLGTVVLCLSVQVYIAWRDLCTARSAMRAEIIKSLLLGSPLFSPYLPPNR